MTMPSSRAQHATHSILRGVLAAAAIAAMALPASAHRIEKHFTVEGRPVVTVRNSNGRIEIKSWNKKEVMVVGDHATTNVEVDTEQAGARIEVNTRVLTTSARSADLQADYTITVPEETQLEIRTGSGSITVESVRGNLTFETLAANVNLKSVGGVITVTTADGSIVCTRCDGSSFSAKSVSGNVQLLQPVMDKITVHTTAGNILFDGDFLRHGVYIMRSDTGNTEVRFGSASSFDLTAKSEHGDVISQATLKPDTHGKQAIIPRMGKAIFGTVGTGNAKVELNSFSGTIRILNRDTQ